MTTSEAFAITCVTCGSRLKVPSRDLIGSIESCPKCGAMVQITAPEDPLPQVVDRLAIGPTGNVDSDAITQSAVDAYQHPPQGPGGNAGGHGPIAPSSIAHSSNPTGTTPPPRSQSPGAPDSATITEAIGYRHEVEAVWQSESTQRTKQLALIAMLSLFGLIAATIVFSQFVRTWRKQAIAENVATAEPDSQSEIPEEPAVIEPVIEPVAESTPPVSDGSPDGLNQALSESDDSGETGDMTPPMPVPPTTTPPIPTLVEPIIEPTTPTAFNPDKLSKGDIDDLLPESPESPEAANNSPPPLTNLPPGLRQFTKLFDMETSGNQGAASIAPPPTIDTVRIEEAAAETDPVEASVAPRKPLDVDKLLLQRYAIDNGGASLAELVLVVSQLTTVPIEIDLIALDAAGVRVDSPIKTPAGWSTVRQWIDATCASLGLIAQTFEGTLVISAADERIDRAIESALQLDDFNEEDAPQVFEWITPLLADDPPAESDEVDNPDAAAPPPSITQLSEDGRSIVPGPSLKSRMRAVLAIEAVRMMRSMPTKLDRWRTQRWMGQWRTGDNVGENPGDDERSLRDWPVVTGGQSGPRLDSPRTAAGLVRSIASLNKSHAIVGWYDAMRHGLYPADSVMPFSRDSSAADLLDEFLGEQDLQTRVCGPGLWYICSEAKYDRLEVIAWYPIPQGSGPELIERIRHSLAIDGITDLPLAFDDSRLIVRCPRYLARQFPRLIEP